MRLSLLIICLIGSLHCFSQGRNERVTISVYDQSLPTIFDSLSVQTGYFFSYNSDILPKGSRFTLSAVDLPIDQFLSNLLLGTNLKYSFYKEQIIINYEAPNRDVKRRKLFNISGKVLDENGEALVGVNVFLNGTTLGTSTDIDGNYLIGKIPPGFYDLVFSYIGYQNGVYNVSEYNGGSRITRHNMEPAINELEEVQVVTDRIKRDGDKWFIYYELFKDDLLGSSENSKHCVISNPEVIDFSFKKSSNTLEAFAIEPLKIRNEAMAYDITYYLESFVRGDDDLRFRGKIKFQNNYTSSSEFSKRKIKTVRKKSYLGSWNHFKKSLLSNSLRKNGFRIYKTKEIEGVNVKKLDERDESDILIFKGNHWELDFDDYLVVSYSKEQESVNFLLDGRFSSFIYQDQISSNGIPQRNPGKQISVLKLLHGPVRLDLNGQVVDKFASTSFGYWSWERLSDLVPLNYEVKFDNF